MPLVIDVSAIIALAFSDENPDYARAVVDAVAEDSGLVPTLFWFEIRNVLIQGERRGRITSSRTSAFLAEVALLPINVDRVPEERAILRLARTRGLTVYDCGYLELAQRLQIPLATQDRELIRAAPLEGVQLWQTP